MKSDALLSIDAVEEYAEQNLGMRKAEKGQVEYVSSAQGDESTVLVSSGEESFLDQIWHWFEQLLG